MVILSVLLVVKVEDDMKMFYLFVLFVLMTL